MKYRKTILMGIVSAAALTAMTACGQNNNTVENAHRYDKVNDVTSGVYGDGTREDTLGDDLEDAGDDIRDGVENAADDVRDGVKDAADGVRDGAEELGEDIRDGAEDMKEKTDDAAKDTEKEMNQ